MKFIFIVSIISLLFSCEKKPVGNGRRTYWEYPNSIQNPIDAENFIWENEVEEKRFYELYWSVGAENLLIKTAREDNEIKIFMWRIILPCDYKIPVEKGDIGSAPETVRLKELAKELFSNQEDITIKELKDYVITKKKAKELSQLPDN